MTAGYVGIFRQGLLAERVKRALAILARCTLCPHACGVNRGAGEVGKCRLGRLAVVSSYGPHFGEEALLVGRGGSGTIFLAHCNLRCVFCQNYTISQKGQGETVSKEDLAAMMLSLQAQGCHNINLVTPTHVVPQILEALEVAVSLGLSLPLVYNCGGYESLATLRLLDGIVDIYMPDMKYADEKTARQLSGIKNYPAVNRAAVKEMHRQAGVLEMDEDGIARRGLLVRHLVLPHGLAGTAQVVRFLSEEVSPQTYTNIMAQYHPHYRAFAFPQLARPLSHQEFQEAVQLALTAGLTRLDSLQRRSLARFF